MLLPNKMKYKTGNKIRVIKTFYPLSTNIIGKESLIEVRDNGTIYLIDLKVHINENCIEPANLTTSSLNYNDIIWKPEIINSIEIEIENP